MAIKKNKIQRAFNIFVCALLDIHSPSLGRRVLISDIWKHPHYYGAYSIKDIFVRKQEATDNTERNEG